MRLLLVENHAVFAEIVSRSFLSAHEVVVAPSLGEARQQLKGGQFGAVLVDFDLDDGKGDELVRELASGGFAGRIVAISSHQRGNAALLQAGAHACCPKTRFDEIAATLEG